MKYVLAVIICLWSYGSDAQYAFELKIDYAMRVGNTDQFSISGSILKGRIEDDKFYYAEAGQEFKIKNIISAKSATSVPVASAGEAVSFSIITKNYEPERGEVLHAVSSRPTYSGNGIRYNPNKMAEGELSCKINGLVYHAYTISKPVLIKDANILDMFFEAENKSVIWLQLNQVTDIQDVPFQTKSDTTNKNLMMVCKVAYMPEGFRPTDLPNNYRAYEDFRGNSGIMVTYVNKYEKRISFEFSGILRPNKRILEDKPDAGFFYITEGKVDNVGWDNF